MASATLEKPNLTRVNVGPGRLSFPFLFEARETDYGDKFSTTLLLPPGYDTKPLLAALTHAAVEMFGKDRVKWPKGMRKPEDVIRDTEEKSHLEGYAPGWKFITASGNKAPGVVDAVKEYVTEHRQVYAGRWAILNVGAFAYKNKTVGVSLGLNNVQLLRNDSTFGRSDPKSDFEDMAAEMEPEKEGGFE